MNVNVQLDTKARIVKIKLIRANLSSVLMKEVALT